MKKGIDGGKGKRGGGGGGGVGGEKNYIRRFMIASYALGWTCILRSVLLRVGVWEQTRAEGVFLVAKGDWSTKRSTTIFEYKCEGQQGVAVKHRSEGEKFG